MINEKIILQELLNTGIITKEDIEEVIKGLIR